MTDNNPTPLDCLDLDRIRAHAERSSLQLYEAVRKHLPDTPRMVPSETTAPFFLPSTAEAHDFSVQGVPGMGDLSGPETEACLQLVEGFRRAATIFVDRCSSLPTLEQRHALLEEWLTLEARFHRRVADILDPVPAQDSDDAFTEEAAEDISIALGKAASGILLDGDTATHRNGSICRAVLESYFESDSEISEAIDSAVDILNHFGSRMASSGKTHPIQLAGAFSDAVREAGGGLQHHEALLVILCVPFGPAETLLPDGWQAMHRACLETDSDPLDHSQRTAAALALASVQDAMAHGGGTSWLALTRVLLAAAHALRAAVFTKGRLDAFSCENITPEDCIYHDLLFFGHFGKTTMLRVKAFASDPTPSMLALLFASGHTPTEVIAPACGRVIAYREEAHFIALSEVLAWTSPLVCRDATSEFTYESLKACADSKRTCTNN